MDDDDLIAPNFAPGRIEQSAAPTTVLQFSQADQRAMWWEPNDDITTIELARCMPIFVTGTANMRQQMLSIFDGLPAECKRHWRVTGI